MSTASVSPTQPAAELTPVAPANPVVGTGFSVTASRLRAWGLKSALALLDQGLTSGAGFLVNLLLARWLAPASYGAFAVAFAVFLFISGFHNVLLLEPLTVMGPGRHSAHLPSYFRAQFAIHFVLVGALVLVGLLGGLLAWRVMPSSPLVGAILGSVIMLPLLLLLWLVRRICYVLQQPGAAVVGSAVYLLLITAGLAVLRHFGWATPFLSFLLMGVASLLASFVLLARLDFSRHQKQVGSISWRAALRENWTYGRWLVGSTVLFSVSTQLQIFTASAMLGLAAAGVLRAMQLPSLVSTQVTTAAGLLVLPSFASDFGAGATSRLHRKAILVSSVLAVFTLIFAGLTWIFSGSIQSLFFAGKYAPYTWLMPILVLMTTAFGPIQGFGMALRAARKPQFDLISNGFAALAAVLSSYFFTKWWGLVGAVTSLALVFVVQSVVTFVCFQSWGLEPKGTSHASQSQEDKSESPVHELHKATR